MGPETRPLRIRVHELAEALGKDAVDVAPLKYGAIVPISVPVG